MIAVGQVRRERKWVRVDYTVVELGPPRVVSKGKPRKTWIVRSSRTGRTQKRDESWLLKLPVVGADGLTDGERAAAAKQAELDATKTKDGPTHGAMSNGNGGVWLYRKYPTT